MNKNICGIKVQVSVSVFISAECTHSFSVYIANICLIFSWWHNTGTTDTWPTRNNRDELTKFQLAVYVLSKRLRIAT